MSLALIALIFFMLGRFTSALSRTFTFRNQMIVLIDAIIKVDKLLSFKGQSIKDLTIQEVVDKVNEQLELTKHG